MPVETKAPDPATLDSLTPLRQLSPEALEELTGQARMLQIPAGTRLFSRDDRDDWTFFVLEGQVELVFPSGPPERVMAGSQVARLPLSPQQPRKATARTVSKARILKLSTTLLDVLATPARDTEYDLAVIEQDGEDVVDRLLYKVYLDYSNDRLVVPVLPEIAIKVRTAVADPESSVAAVARIANADASIASRLLQVANSPAYAGVTPVDSCRDAVVRLGLDTTRDIIMALAMRGIFRSRSTVLNKRMVALWRHSVQVAAIACTLADGIHGVDCEGAMLAGLLHDIGAVSLLSQIEAYPELLSSPDKLDETIALLRPQVGGMILRKWRFSDAMVTVAVEVEDWQRDSESALDYCDVVMVAQLLSMVGAPELSAYPPLASVPAFKKLSNLGFTAESTIAVLKEARESVRALESALMG